MTWLRNVCINRASREFQRKFYDEMCRDKVKSKGLFSCSYQERFNSSLLVEDKSSFDSFHELFSKIIGNGKCWIMDCCTGSGLFIPVLRGFSKGLVGVDLSLELLLKAKELTERLNVCNTILVQSEAERLPLKSNRFDAIVMIDSLHHVEDQQSVLRELQRVAKNGADLLLVEPNIANPLVFLAHFLPREERGALRSNTSARIRRLLRPWIRDIRIVPLNYVASCKSSVLGQFLSAAAVCLFGTVFPFWPIRFLVKGTFMEER